MRRVVMAGVRAPACWTSATTLFLVSAVVSPSWAQEVSGEASASAGAVEVSELGKEEDDAASSPQVPDYAGLRATPGYHDTAQATSERPYMSRYLPKGNTWEVTLALGLLFPSPKHNLKVATLPVDEYSKVAPQFSVRLGYFPLSFAGAELQSFIAGSQLRDSGYSAVLYGFSGHLVAQLPLWTVIPFATVGIGALGAVSETMGHDRDFSFIWGAGVKSAISRRVSLRLDFQDNMGQKRDAKNGRQTHHPAIQLGASFVFERHEEKIPLADSDYDGLFDRDDECPREGALTKNGCPEVVDSDSDGFLDPDDQCPTEPGLAPDGCPDRDTDQDGVPTPADQCPEVAGEAPSGCPNLDPDADGIEGPADRCPGEPETKNGFEDQDGCPDEMPEEIKRFTGVIPGIQFKQGTAEIAASSHAVLDSAAKILVDYPSVQLEVSGHTSSEGSEQRNQDLSVQRAEAVKKYFVDKGIVADRILARGAGASEPVEDNATKAGREKNRRIEFRVLAQP